VEGDDFADPEFLDSPGIIPGAIRLDDREQLVRERILRESFSWWRPPKLERGAPCINDLARIVGTAARPYPNWRLFAASRPVRAWPTTNFWPGIIAQC
jgi:hypothetical protein